MKSKTDAFIRTSVIAGHPGESEESFTKLCEFMESFGFDRFNTFAYSNEETTAAYNMEQLPDERIEEQAAILGQIADRTTKASLEKMVGRKVELVVESESDEHEYLLSARPLMWAVDIDGEILINDTSDLPVEYGKIYEANITELVGDQLLATLVKQV